MGALPDRDHRGDTGNIHICRCALAMCGSESYWFE
jgi:hypothetical protein